MEWTPPSSGYGTDRVCVTSDNRGCGQVKISISGHIVAHDYSPVGRSFGRWSIPKTRRRSDVITFCVEGVYERRRAACIDQAACRTFVMAAWSPPTNVELLYSEPWTVNKGLGENIDAFKMQCYRRCMRISCTEYVPNDEVLRRVGQDRALLGQVKSRKLKYFEHVTMHNRLEKISCSAPCRARGDKEVKGNWMDNIIQWTEKGLVDIVRLVKDRNGFLERL